jgi:tetratricopeptide (TPR) repeat protein
MRKHPFLYMLFIFLITAVSASQVHADYKQAVALYNQGQYEKAIQELKPDIDKAPDWEFGHRLLGLCYLNLNNNALAAVSLSRAAELESTAFVTYYGLGQAYFNLQQYEKSISALNRAEPLAANEQNPESEVAKVHKLRGSAYYRTGKFAEAARDISNVVATDRSDSSYLSMLGISYFNLNRTDEAIQALEQALSMKPGDNTIQELLANTYLKKGTSLLSGKKFGEAVQALLKARNYNPANGYIHYNLGEAYLFQKEYSNAESALQEAGRLLPENAGLHERMGLVYEKQEKWDSALKSYQRANALNPSRSLQESIDRVTENKSIATGR